MGKLLKHDWREGMSLNKKVFILLLIVLGCSFMLFWLERKSMLAWGLVEGEFSLGDALWYIHRGSSYVPSEGDTAVTYQFPIVWVLQMVVLHYLVGYYPLRDWQNCGIQVLLRAGSRRRWWCAKVLWVFAMNVLFAAVQTVGVAVLVWLCGGSLTLQLTDLSLAWGAGNLLINGALSTVQLGLYLMVFPFLVQTILCFIQLTFMFLVGPFLAFIFIFAYEIAATYAPSAWLLANYAMCWRANAIDPFYNMAMEMKMGVLLMLFFAAISFFVGFLHIKGKDILGDEVR